MPESLLKDLFPKWQPSKAGKYRRPAGESLRDLADGAGRLWERKWLKRSVISALVVMLCAGGAFAYVELRPRAVPDVFADDLADVLDYTLLTDGFNKMPVEERLALIKKLIERLKSMDSNDSAMVAGFAAGIGGKAREQLMKNAERLMVDIWDKFSHEYAGVKPEDRDAYLDKAFVDMSKMLEDVSGFDLPVKDGQRMEQARKDIKRGGNQKMPEARPMEAGRAGQFMGWMNDRAQKHTNPAQRGRMSTFARDMSRRMTGDSVSKPVPQQPAPGQPGANPPSSPAGGNAPAAPAAPPAAPTPPASPK